MVRNLFESGIIMITGCFISVALIRFLGEVMDRIVATLIDVGVYDVPPEWQTDPGTLINLFYIICMMPAVISIILGILRSQQRVGVAVGEEPVEEFEVQELR
jgi:MFS superfamily sulfate permease-like transporter